MRNDFETGYLMHWGLKKGAQKDNHKYVARVELKNGKYRYFYTLDEYRSYLKDKTKEASKKINDTKKKLEDSIDKGLKRIDKILNKKKYDQVKKDLSTEGAKEEKKNTQKVKQNTKKQKELSTISAKEKSDAKAAARKAEKEAAYKAHLKELKEKGIEKKRKEKEQLQQITQKQSEKKMNAAIETRKKQKESWLTEFRKKAKDLFCKDAKDSAKEDHTKHADIPIKKSVLSKDQDMAAVNRGRRFYNTKLDQMFESRHDKNFDKTTYHDFAQKAEEVNVNCASCTIAYDLRRRGYDVVAPRQTGENGFNLDEMLYCYKTPDGKDPHTFESNNRLRITGARSVYNVKSIDAIQGGKHSSEEEDQKSRYRSGYYSFETTQIKKIENDILDSYPEGSYGILATQWQGGGGHAQIWSIENGEVVIRDAQINEKDTLENRLDRSISCEIVRIDNLELNDMAYEYAMAEELDGAKIIKNRK